MLRAIGLLLLLVAGVALAWFLRDLGGAIEVRVGDTFVGVPLWLALLALVVGFVVLHGLLRGWALLRAWPSRIRARRAARHRTDGDAAVTRALIALAAGAADQARVESRRARQLLGDTPHTLLLTAEAERLSGREDKASEAFQLLAERPDGRFLGLRGLLRAAMAREDWAEAQLLAREAEEAQPGAVWVREERALLAVRTRDWREALSLSAPGMAEAPLALAAAQQEPDPARAAEMERRAFAADPAFAPAAIAHADRLREGGSPRRAQAVLEGAWNAGPQPEVAAAYLRAETDRLARVKAAETLAAGTRDHPESRLLLGRTAMEASLTGRARAELEGLATSDQADRRVFLALVELERAEHGDTAVGRAAEARWLRAAAEAKPEPVWRCAGCGTEYDRWAAECPACQAVGRIGWTGHAPVTYGAEAYGTVATLKDGETVAAPAKRR